MNSENVEVLERLRDRWAGPDERVALDAAIAALSAPKLPVEVQPGSAVFNCPNCPVAVESQWLTPECPECGERCFLDPSAAPQPPAEAQPVAWRFWAPEILGVPYKEWTGWSTDEGFRKHAEDHGWAAEYAYRSDAPSAPLGNSGAVSALRVLSDFNPGADEFTDALSCLQGYFEQEIQSDQLNDLSDAIELPDGFRVVEHLPGIWEYQFDIEDEADEDSDRKVSGTSWNHPALAAIAAWSHAYDALANPPLSAPVGVEAMPGIRRELAKIVQRDEGETVWIEPNEAAAILRALAHQPAAVDGGVAQRAAKALLDARSHIGACRPDDEDEDDQAWWDELVRHALRDHDQEGGNG